jgi:hypothetical protein
MAQSPLANFGTLLATVHVLEDGRRVRLRLARPGDPLPPHQTFYNPRERLVLAALEMIGGREQLVGVADVTLSETTVAAAARDLLAEVTARRQAA